MNLSITATSTKVADIFHHTLTHADGSITTHYTAHAPNPATFGRGDDPIAALTDLYAPTALANKSPPA